jgi:hypothetical protein
LSDILTGITQVLWHATKEENGSRAGRPCHFFRGGRGDVRPHFYHTTGGLIAPVLLVYWIEALMARFGIGKPTSSSSELLVYWIEALMTREALTTFSRQ